MKRSVVGAVIFIVMAAGGAYLFLRAGLPDYTGNISVRGLSNPVGIERNRFAMPTITSQNLPDLFFSWGYVNAQDRLFQMEFTKRAGQGRISEFAGDSALTKDIFLRAVGFQERAKSAVEGMAPGSKALYQRYVDGVNCYLDTKGPNLYMKLLGMKKEKWEIADSVLIGMMLNWSLAYNMKHEIMYHRIIKKVGAILCTDMQVHQSKMPNDFYIIRVKAGDFDVTGAQVAGLPFIASGYNRHIAWGLTNQGADMVDLFRETIDWEKKTCRVGG
jgi:acyl-homoserine lactone acylase PvdQ